MRSFFRRLAYFFQRRQFEADLADEMAFHREMKERELARCGEATEDVRVAATRALGSMTLARERSREVWTWSWLEALFYDVRFALRGLRRDWRYALAAITMLAPALGLNSTVFTIADARLFRGIPLVKDADWLVRIQQIFPSGAAGISYPDFEEWRAQAPAFEGIAFAGFRPVTLRIGTSRQIDTGLYAISANTFELLGVRPMLGRDFVAADERPGVPPVAILTHRAWESRFGKRPDVLGTTVAINETPTTIIGVMPERFDFPDRGNSLWVPVAPGPDIQRRGQSGYVAVGRLRRGATTQQARTELQTIQARLAAAYPETNRDLGLSVGDSSGGAAGPNGQMIYGSLFAGAWLVLLIACANLANLTLVRTAGRWRDLSTRIALGAGTTRMVRQLLMESLLLAAAAAVLGWWITTWSVHRWSVATESVYEVIDYSVNHVTAIYLVTISVAAALLVSVVPIATVVQVGWRGTMKSDTRATHGLQGKQLANVLVAGQVVLAIVLLLGAGVLVRSLLNIVNAETGVREPERVLVGSARLASDKYPSAAARLAYFDRLESQLKSVTGIEAASVASEIPVNGMGSQRLEIEGRATAPGRDEFTGAFTISPAYFKVIGAAPISGRGFDDSDRANTLPVAMVNESFAATFWPDGDAIGKRFRLGNQQPPGAWLTIVGVAPNIMQGDPTRKRFLPFVYMPLQQRPRGRAFFLARTRGPAKELAPTVRAAITDIDPDVTLDDFGSLEASFAFDRDRMDLAHMELGKYASIAPIFAVMSLLLAAIGLGAVMAHSVAQRTKEIGVRMAIGATPSNVRRMVLREGMTPVMVGLPFGLTASLAVNRILQSQLVGVSPYDAATMVGAPLLLIAIALVACQIPARRATRTDPMVALRCE